MSEYPTIKAADIQPGDTIRWETLVCGIGAEWRMTISRIDTQVTGLVKVYNSQGGVRHFDLNDDFVLVDRQAQKLPTKPGSLVYVEEYEGEEIEPPFLAFLDVNGYWIGEMRFPGGRGYGFQSDITKWSPATVTKATP